jgi:putative transposase
MSGTNGRSTGGTRSNANVNCGIGLMTPAAVHHGRSEALHTHRARVLDAAYAATPERFVRQPPKPPALPVAAWINEPDTNEAAH